MLILRGLKIANYDDYTVVQNATTNFLTEIVEKKVKDKLERLESIAITTVSDLTRTDSHIRKFVRKVLEDRITRIFSVMRVDDKIQSVIDDLIATEVQTVIKARLQSAPFQEKIAKHAEDLENSAFAHVKSWSLSRDIERIIESAFESRLKNPQVRENIRTQALETLKMMIAIRRESGDD